MVPKLGSTGRNAQQSRCSLSHFKVSLRPNSSSIHIVFFSRSTVSLTAPSRSYLPARWKRRAHFTAFHLFICSREDVRLKRWSRLFPCRSLKSFQSSPFYCLLQGQAGPPGKPEHQLHTDRLLPTKSTDTQQPITANNLAVTYCAHSNYSHEILVTSVAFNFSWKVKKHCSCSQYIRTKTNY